MSDASQAAGAGGLPALQAGSKVGVGRFALVRPLGRGGMGEVWLAQDERLQEPVALKFLPPEVRADPVALDDLRRETARSHRLTHPNIVRIHDFHEEADGLAFIAMEYVNGPTLAELRLEQPRRVLIWDFIKPLVQQLCAALDYAHGEKVVHRDLKPGNIMVDSKGRLKLADFGIAATVSDSVSRVSGRHATSGTLPYMSPQQLAGKRPSVGDDIYALGATLYELLTSKPPFYTGDITHQVLHEAAEPPDERLAGLDLVNPVPGDVAALIMACLAKEPTQRPPSARAVAEWVGLEVTRKATVESLAEAMFSAGDSSQGGASGEQLQAAAAGPAVSKRKLALLLSGTTAALLLAGAGAWYAAGHRAAGRENISPGTPPPVPLSAGHPGSPASEDGFVSLFNGQDLSDWDGDPRFWSFKEGAITGEASSEQLKGFTYLIWHGGTVQDFELRLRYRMTGNMANSGIQYRSSDQGNHQVHGYQMELLGPAATGKLFVNLYPDPKHVLADQGQRTSARYVNGHEQVTLLGEVNRTNEIQAAIRSDDWNEVAIIAQGNHFIHRLNGLTVIDATEEDPDVGFLSGLLALEISGRYWPGPASWMKVQFKDIRLKRLRGEAAEPSDIRPMISPESRTTALGLKPSQRWTNTLGIVFVPVPGTKVLFSIWDTRVKDFEAFVTAAGYDTSNEMGCLDEKQVYAMNTGYNWRKPGCGFRQGPTHPVVGVSWQDAQAFCAWLTKREREAGRLSQSDAYRLPSDAEWSEAVGLN